MINKFKNFNLIQKILIIVLILFIGSFSLLAYFSTSELSIIVNTDGSLNVDQPQTINITTKDGSLYMSADELTIKIQHKYDSSDLFESTLTPYASGEYSLVFTPSNSGEYNITVTTVYDGQTQLTEQTLAIN